MRKLVIISVILGLGITLFFFNFSNDFSPIQPVAPDNGLGISGGICLGINLNTQQYTSDVVRVDAGLPIKAHLVSNSIGNVDCLAIQPDPGALNIFKSAVKTWQFYVDWLIWSVASVILGYVLTVLKKNIQKRL